MRELRARIRAVLRRGAVLAQHPNRVLSRSVGYMFVTNRSN
ncbi:hypothetical protein [Shinella sp.]